MVNVIPMSRLSILQVQGHIYLKYIKVTAGMRLKVKCFYSELNIEARVCHYGPFTLSSVIVGVGVVWTSEGSSRSCQIPTTAWKIQVKIKRLWESFVSFKQNNLKRSVVHYFFNLNKNVYNNEYKTLVINKHIFFFKSWLFML